MWRGDIDSIFCSDNEKIKKIYDFIETGEAENSPEHNEFSVEDEIISLFENSEDDFSNKVRNKLKFDPSKYSKRVNRKQFGSADFDLNSVPDNSDTEDKSEDEDDFFDLGI